MLWLGLLGTLWRQRRQIPLEYGIFAAGVVLLPFFAGTVLSAGRLVDDALFARDSLNGSGTAPLYRRLQERIKSAIESGDLKPQDALPGERDIAQALSVSRVTVRKALSGLVGAGLLEQRQGSGTFVSRKPPLVEQPLSRLTSFSEDMRLRGLETTSRWLVREV